MFGYITVNRPELKVREAEEYRSWYCGLCAELHRRYGRRGQLLLSYDCTFLILLLNGVYEPGSEKCTKRCIVHPAKPHEERSSRFTAYAADMNILLGYLKAVDDYKDEGSRKAAVLTRMLRKDYLRIREEHPAKEKAVRENMILLRRAEQKKLPKDLEELLARIDRTAGYTGRFLAEIFAPYDDIWAPDLKQTGFYLGKFVYLMDAWDDLEKDRKNGSYNVFCALQDLDPDGFEKGVKEILLDTAACCCRAFERLPVVQDVNILRNVLYSGIWTKFGREQQPGENT